jgi:hypothetical protein
LACVACASGTVAAAMSDGTPRANVPLSIRPAAARSHRPRSTTASNRRAAVRDAKALLLGVVPPAGAVLRSSGTRAPLLTAAFASAVAYRRWTVPADAQSVLSSVEAHLPPGSKVVVIGYIGPNPSSQLVIRAWPPVEGVLDVRWLEVEVTRRAADRTLLYAESQSQWVLTRPLGERIPSGVREVDVTSGGPGKPPFLSRRVTNRAKVSKLVALFDSLGIVQPVGIGCPEQGTTGATVAVRFRGGTMDRLLAEATVSSAANASWPPDAAGWACYPITFRVDGRDWNPLAGNVITPIQRLLHVKLATRN